MCWSGVLGPAGKKDITAIKPMSTFPQVCTKPWLTVKKDITAIKPKSTISPSVYKTLAHRKKRHYSNQARAYFQ